MLVIQTPGWTFMDYLRTRKTWLVKALVSILECVIGTKPAAYPELRRAMGEGRLVLLERELGLPEMGLKVGADKTAVKELTYSSDGADELPERWDGLA